MQCAVYPVTCQSRCLKPVGPDTHQNLVQSQHAFIERSYPSHTWTKQAESVMVQVVSGLTFGDKKHLPNYLYLTQSLASLKRKGQEPRGTLGVVTGGGGVSQDSGAACQGDQNWSWS